MQHSCPHFCLVFLSPEMLNYSSPVGKNRQTSSLCGVGKESWWSVSAFQINFQPNLLFSALSFPPLPKEPGAANSWAFEGLWCEPGFILAFATVGSRLLNQLLLFLFQLSKFSFPILSVLLGLCLKNHSTVILVWFWEEMEVNINVQSVIFNWKSSFIFLSLIKRCKFNSEHLENNEKYNGRNNP